MTRQLPALFIGSSVEGLSAANAFVLSGGIDAEAAKKVFGTILPSVWAEGSTALAMPNHVEDSWKPLPNIAQVSALWRGA